MAPPAAFEKTDLTLPFELSGGILGILLAFRTGQSYDRFWEGEAERTLRTCVPASTGLTAVRSAVRAVSSDTCNRSETASRSRPIV